MPGGRPGGRQAPRPLHFFWALDTSASMATAGKVDALNAAVRATLPAMAEADAEEPYGQVLVRALAFGSGARWHIATPTPVGQVVWTDLDTYGRTEMGLALREIAGQLGVDQISGRSFPPVIVLVSDGQPTDDFEGGLAALLATAWGTKAVRVAVAIGGDADMSSLERFTSNPSVPPLTASNADELVHYLRWVSTVAQKESSRLSRPPDGDDADAGATAPAPPPAPVRRIPAPPRAVRDSDLSQQVTW